jgi:hypothetical protein
MNKTEISFDRRLAASKGVLIQQLKDESVLLHVAKGQYYGLNETGTRMWNELIAASSIQAAYEKLSSEFDIAQDQLRQDLTALIEDLLEHELLEVAAA